MGRAWCCHVVEQQGTGSERADAELPGLVWHMATDLGLIQAFRVPEFVFDRFLLAVRHGYHDNPYHLRVIPPGLKYLSNDR
eukprot:COSAG01_NODE_3316_length_6272_cov_4.305376_4_plen_81_part_00